MLKEIKTKMDVKSVGEEPHMKKLVVAEKPVVMEKPAVEEPTPKESMEGEVALALADLMAHAMHSEKRRIEPEMEEVVPVVEESRNAAGTNSVVVSLSAVATWAVLSLLLL